MNKTLNKYVIDLALLFGSICLFVVGGFTALIMYNANNNYNSSTMQILVNREIDLDNHSNIKKIRRKIDEEYELGTKK